APRLQWAGIAAAPVCHGRDVALDPHLHATGFFEEIDHPEAGPRPYQSLPFRFANNGLPRLRPAPMLGQHTDEVLREWAGLSESQLEALAANGTTSNDP